MEQPDDRIIKFIKKHHLLSLSMTLNDISWSCSCFYVYLGKKVQFLITSDEDTKHIGFVKKNPNVSGTIATETIIVGKIRGIQFAGNIEKIEKHDYVKYKMIYLKKFPFAVLKNTDLWLINPDILKMTDNRLGFGKKLYWHRT